MSPQQWQRPIPAGSPIDGGNQGSFGDDGTFVIAPKGTGISR